MYMDESETSVAIRTSITADSSPTCAFSCNDFNNKLCSSMYEMQQGNILCDYNIIAEGETFNVHKNILASNSDFFKVMFNTEMKEKNENVYRTEMMDSKTMKDILNYVYTGKINLDIYNRVSVLQAASYFQITSLLEIVEKYLRSAVCVSDCVDIWHMTKMYNMDKLTSNIKDFIMIANLEITQNEYNKLTYDEMLMILSSDELKTHKAMANDITELHLLKIVKGWMEENHHVDFKDISKLKLREKRWSIFIEMMTKIRWSLISPKDLVNMDTEVKNVMLQIPECMRMLLKANDYHVMISEQHLMQDDDTRMRWNKPCIAEFRGRDIKFYDFHTGTMYQHLSSTPLSPDISYSVMTEMNGFIFIVGGYSNTDLETIAKCRRYDPRYDNWTELASMSTPRQLFAVVVHGEHLYAIGGWNGVSNADTYEIYDAKCNKWTSVKCLYAGIGHKACVVDGTIYISGGGSRGGPSLASLYSFEISTQKWLQRANMQYCRHSHVMARIENSLYVLGGGAHSLVPLPPKTYSERCPEIINVNTIEKYSIESDQWTVCSLSLNITGATCFLNDDKIYICKEKVYVFSEELDQITELPNIVLSSNCYHTLMFK